MTVGLGVKRPPLHTPSAHKRYKRASLDSSSKITQKVLLKDEQISPDATTLVTSATLRRQVPLLFVQEEVILRPCVSARLFAAFFIQQRQHKNIPINFMGLLSALVEVEYVAHQDVLTDNRVHFSGFDCSSTQPASIRAVNSIQHRARSIHALSNAMNELQTIREQVNAQSNGQPRALLECLDDLLRFLEERTENPDDAINGHIAASFELYYPTKRVVKAAKHHLEEFRKIRRRITTSITVPQNGNHPSVLWTEQRLAEFVGQALKFHLRLLFDPAPPRFCAQDVDYENRSKQYSKVSKKIKMTFSSGNGEAADDEAIAAFFSTALKHIYHYFGADIILNATTMTPLFPNLFCQRPATNRGIATRGKDAEGFSLTDEDLQDIRTDIREAIEFLTTARSVCFVHKLLSTRSVQKEISALGGWDDIETYASISWKYDLGCVCDAHLVLLANMDALMSKLQSLVRAMEPRIDACLASLNATAKRFHLHTKSLKILQQYPQLPAVKELFDDAMSVAAAIPIINTRS